MNAPLVRVLVVDDSSVVRGLLTRALSRDPAIEVAGTVMHAEAALAWLRTHRVEVVVLDRDLPLPQGFETLRLLRQQQPHVRLVLASYRPCETLSPSRKILMQSADACVTTSVSGALSASLDSLAQQLIPLIKGSSEIPQTKPETPSHTSDLKPAESSAKTPLTPSGGQTGQASSQKRLPPTLLVIGASTGGPQALSQVLRDLGPDFETPTLVVQHMPARFTSILASQLRSETGRVVKEAEDGEAVRSGCTYIAPGGYHLEITRQESSRLLKLHQGQEEHYCRPSVNPLYRSAARIAGSRTLAVMLTGMGSDGLEGAGDLVTAGAYILVQDQASSVVWGMPGALAQHGLAHEVLPLDKIGNRILELCSTPRPVVGVRG